jgi:hypothetical protein
VELARKDLENALQLYIQGADPLSACRGCMGTSGKKTQHLQSRDKAYMIDNIENIRVYLDI